MWKQFWPLLLGFLPSLAAEKEYSSLSDAHQFHTGYSSHLSLPQRFIEIDRYSLPTVSQLLHSNEIWIYNFKKCRLTVDSLKLCLIFLNNKLKKSISSLWFATLCVSPKNNWLKTFTSLNLYLCKTWKATCQQHVSCQSNIACIWSETPAAGNHVCNKILLAMINKEAESGEEKNRTKCGPWKQRVGQTKEIDEERERLIVLHQWAAIVLTLSEALCPIWWVRPY